MAHKVLITVCGRAGSKGFKNKNLKTFLGEPLVYYTLSAAEHFSKKVFDIAEVDICLNTDSEELARIVAEKYPDVYYIKREAVLGESNVPKPVVWYNCVEIMQNKKGIQYDYMIDLDITSPLRQIDDVYNAFEMKLQRVDTDMVESMCLSRRNPYFNMMKEEGAYVTPVMGNCYAARQQASKIYDENASIYVLNADYLSETGIQWDTIRIVPYVMRDTAVLDIDSEEDLFMMEVIGRYLFDNVETYKKVRDNIRK